MGPIHAGIIEPGHFRFSIVGEKVLRLPRRSWATCTKGIEKHFEDFTVAQTLGLRAVSPGDSTVAYAWAYASSPRIAAGRRAAAAPRTHPPPPPPPKDLGDLGALGNDAALTFALSQFMRLKEDWLRTGGEVFGTTACS
ncbi:MAG: hypothetical protein IPH30_16900 [Betaproteobacteria bacterium]|nr:hypothetical protein [Betaproteobacteria bacterium]